MTGVDGFGQNEWPCLKQDRTGLMKSFPPRPARGLLTPVISALLLAMNISAAPAKILFDFETAAGLADWQIVNDSVMGGASTSNLQLANGVAVFQGNVSLDHNGGFASVRSLPAQHDLTGCDAFVLRVRGDGRRYKFTVRTDPGFDSAIYQAVFATKKGEWAEHRLPLREFAPTFRGRVLAGEPPLDPAQVKSVGFLISDKQEGPFQLEVAWIKASGFFQQPID